MKYLILILISTVSICVPAQTTTSSPVDSIQLRIITKRHQNFPNISVAFEALHHNEIIEGLEKEQITVFEGNNSYSPYRLSKASNNYPINISLVIDHSGSMSEDYKQLIDSTTGRFLDGIEFDSLGSFIIKYPENYTRPIVNARTAVKNFLQEFTSDKDYLQIIGFSTKVDVVSKFSNDNTYLTSVVDSIKTDYHTAFLDGLQYGISELKDRDGINIIIALTDGIDNSSHISEKKVIENANENSIPIYTIGLGEVNQDFLSEVSSKTNGSFFYTDNSNVLDSIYQTIQERIKHIYDLDYESLRSYNKDTLRRLKISVEIDSLLFSSAPVQLNIPQYKIDELNNNQSRSNKLMGAAIMGTLISIGIVSFFLRHRRRTRKKTEVS